MNAGRITVCLFILLVAQSSLLPLLHLPLEKPDLALLVTIYVALASESEKATLTGFWAGLVQDAFSLEPPGLHSFAKSLIGFLCASLRGSMFAAVIPMQIIAVVLLTGVHGMVVDWVGGALRPRPIDAGLWGMITGELPRQAFSNLLFWMALSPLFKRMLPPEE